ncbi:kinase-like domain-containing protein [Staphylotrichum tortipilum]|uniref:Kinase-like domain-containing protein n=1 Tax=Staphylotrichum tortipilum TaxID=2831512 RepID=A0AAN6MHN5_9PEZI|nr:kinase-like domain-containing protein [Staphylotrichum longicolle]
MGDTNKPGDDAANTKDRGKRDREYGMYQDPLVSARTEEIERGMNKELQAMSEQGRLTAVYSFVTEHRPGTPIGVRRPLRGGYNVIFVVDFTDGSALLRVAVPGSVAYPDEKVRAEVATMRYVERMTSIPVPHVYHWGTAAENPLGFGAFIIIDYITHHQSLCQLLGDPTVKDDTRAYLDSNVPQDKLARMYRQVIDILLQLSKLEMPRIGALRQDGPDSFSVASRPMTQDMNNLLLQGGIPWSVLPPPNATYATSDEWYAVLADLHVAHLTFQHNRAVDSADDCRDKFRKNSKNKKETFRLWVDDLRPHNILIDANLNIVGVIDWEWAYFAPESYTQDPPWWLLLGRPEYWRGTILEFRDEFVKALDIFLKELRTVEEKQLRGHLVNGQNERPIAQRLKALNLDADATVHLSDRMRQNWDSGLFWANYAARRCYGFEPVFWEFLDEPFFGRNVEGGYEGRMHLLSEKVKRRMERFVEKKLDENKESKIVDWDAGEARFYLAEILADLDE